MTDRDVVDIPESVHRAAGRWLARRNGPEAEHSEAAFKAWIEADPAHRLAYEDAERLWRESRLLAGMPTGQVRGLDKAPFLMRRNVQGALAGVAVAIALGFVTVQMTGLAPSVTLGTKVRAATYQTGRGEIRTFTLADGSRVTLDTNSRIRVSISDNERRIVLDEGRARFNIRNATSSRFTVVTRAGTLIAQGPVFDVSAFGQDVRVAVLEGKAVVESKSPGGVAVTLTAGQQADMGGTLDPSPVSRAEAQWVDGMLALDKTPLGDAIASINRYNSVKVKLARPDLARLAITGGFDVHDPAVFAHAAASALGLVVSRPDPETLLLALPATSSDR